MTELGCKGGEGGRGVGGFSEVGEEGEGDWEANSVLGSRGGGEKGSSLVKGGACVDEERVVDGGPCDAACGAEGSSSGREGDIIEVAKAKADGAVAGGPSSKVGSCKGMAEGVTQYGGAHEEKVVEELSEGGEVAKGDIPRVRVADVDHGRHDLLGFHKGFGNSLVRNRDGACLGSGGYAATHGIA